MSEIPRETAKPISDYITDFNISFEIDPSKTTLIVIDMQYATGSRKAGLGKRLTKDGKLEELASERFDRIENVVVPNLQRMLTFFRMNSLRIIYVTIGAEMHDYSDASPHMARFFMGTNNRKGELEHEIIEEVRPLPREPVINKTTISAFTSTGIDSILRSMAIEYILFAGMSTNMCVGTTARDAADRGWEIVNFQRLFGRVESSENVIAEIKRNLNYVVSRR
jgi:nicotinamidase-related amidase